MLIRNWSLIATLALSCAGHAYDIRFEGTGRGRSVDFVFQDVHRAAFAGELTFSDLRTNLLFKTMVADLEGVIQVGEFFSVNEQRTAGMTGGYQKGGTVYAKNFALATTNDRAAALQIAVWAARYNSDLANNTGVFRLDDVWLSNNRAVYLQALAYFNGATGAAVDAVYLEPDPLGSGQAQYMPAPEPATLIVLGLGLLAVRRKKSSV